MSLVRACSSGDSVSLYKQTWEASSLLSFSGQSILCRQALFLQGRCQISGVRTCLLAEVVFHSPEVLRSRGGSCEDLGGVRKLCKQGTLVLEWTGRDLCPYQAGLSASLVNAVSGPVQLVWSTRCVPLTRGLGIQWWILCGSLRVSHENSLEKELSIIFGILLTMKTHIYAP